MQPEKSSTLDVIYENWRIYQGKLRDAIAPLTEEQLQLSILVGERQDDR